VTLTCACCGFEAEFPDGEAAFQAGWDCPPHFTASPVCCDLCPSVAALGLIDHSKAHERWEREGRPREFDMRDLPSPASALAEDFLRAGFAVDTTAGGHLRAKPGEVKE
jgi:hypothetical protein